MTAVLPSWHAAALCRTEEGDWFSDSQAGIAAAKAVCARCAVRDACLADAVARGEADGVWGGQSAADRLEPTFLVLADPGPPPHAPSRSCYVEGCRDPECCRLNTAYVASLRARAVVTTPSRVEASEQLAIGWEAVA